jgi:poly(A) polymerase
MVPFAIPESLIYEPSMQAKMPIITPAFPSMNSTYNVSESTRHVLLTELEKGAIITQALSEDPSLNWKRLFKKLNFF